MSRGHFRLAQHSLRRRRVISLISSATPRPASEECAEPAEVASLVPEEPTPPVRVDSIAMRMSQRAPVPPPPAPTPTFDVVPYNPSFLGKAEKLTWVFAGDSLLAGHAGDDEMNPLVSELGEMIHSWPWRRQDRIVDVLEESASVFDLIQAWEGRVVSHYPDVVVLFFGHSDAASGMKGFDRFEATIEGILKFCNNLGIAAIVNTPPCLPERDESRLADRLIYLEALRAAAKTYDAILVDHWEEWEWVAVEIGGTESWYAEDGRYPGPVGLKRMERLFAQTLGTAASPITIGGAR
ncbi:MAG: SGNH/GDSL hydrolase family protein [Planctomycetaceae bacterium]|nr:SGNH/GDSL hydrolase family protein [Planctomycetaceae bacterium]